MTTTVPKSSPWGSVQGGSVLAEGIVSVYTAGHGGIKLDATRNALIPESARASNGWYEEDCEWAIPALVFPEAFAKPGYDMAAEAARSCKHWNPEAYTAITGQEVALEESGVLRDRAFKLETADKFVVSCAWGYSPANTPWVPEGKVGVVARRASDGKEIYGLVSAERYAARTGFYVMDLTIDCEIANPHHH